MIFDFGIAERTSSLQEYYLQLYDLHAIGHTSDYMLVHQELIKRGKECNSYTEFGVNQGATLSAMLLQHIKKVRAYDINLTPYYYARTHFEQFAMINDIDFKIFETDTLNCHIEPVDLLYIDTLHQYDHLVKELNLHGDKVLKYIVFHDTFTRPELKQAVQKYVNTKTCWNIITECNINVGFMTIKRE